MAAFSVSLYSEIRTRTLQKDLVWRPKCWVVFAGCFRYLLAPRFSWAPSFSSFASLFVPFFSVLFFPLRFCELRQSWECSSFHSHSSRSVHWRACSQSPTQSSCCARRRARRPRSRSSCGPFDLCSSGTRSIPSDSSRPACSYAQCRFIARRWCYGFCRPDRAIHACTSPTSIASALRTRPGPSGCRLGCCIRSFSCFLQELLKAHHDCCFVCLSVFVLLHSLFLFCAISISFSQCPFDCPTSVLHLSYRSFAREIVHQCCICALHWSFLAINHVVPCLALSLVRREW